MATTSDTIALGIDVDTPAQSAADIDKVTAALARLRAEAAAISGGSSAKGAADAVDKLGHALQTHEVGVERSRGAARGLALEFSHLSVAAALSEGSMLGLVRAAGLAATDIAELSGSAALAASASGIGAVVTVVATLIGLLASIPKHAFDAKKAIESLREEAEKTASSEALRSGLAETTKALKLAQDARDQLASQARERAPISAFGPGGAPPVTAAAAAIAGLDRQIKKLEQDRTKALDELEKRGPEVAKQLAETQDRLDDETIKLSVQRTQGAFAARRVAAETEFEREAKRLGGLVAIEGQQKDAVDAARRQRDEQLHDLDVEESQQLAGIRASASEKAAKAREAAEIAASKTIFDRAESDLQQQLASRKISEAQFIGFRLAAQRADIKANEDAQVASARATRDAELVRIGQEAGPAADAKRRAARLTFEQDVAKIHADGLAKNAAADLTAANASAALAEKIAKTVEQANIAVLESQHRFVEAAQLQVKEEFRQSIDTALAEIVGGGGAGLQAGLQALVAIQARIQQITGQAGVKQSQATAQQATAQLQADLAQTQALVAAGALTEAQGQDQVVAAYERTQAAIAAVILQEERQLALDPQDKELALSIQELNTQYIQLGNTIAGLKDPFRALKDAAESATGAALANFLSGASRLFSQSHVEINALAGELSNARFELNQLLAIPVNERTSGQTARITEVRGEVENLTVALNNSKQAITSWKTLFVDALQSVLDALIKVAAQAAATQIFSFFGGLFGGLSAPTPRFGTFNLFQKADGGLISGPSGTDRVPGMLTAGEFVVREPAVRALGTNFMETINRAGFGGSPIALHRIPRHFADGGMVTRSAEAAPGGSQTRVLIQHTDDYVGRVMESPRGEQAIVQAILRNPRAVAAAIGLARPR